MQKNLSDSELEARFDAFKKKNPPDSLDYLERLRPLLIRFHLDGYSRIAMYRFLKAENLVSCHAASFYRWLADNVDFKAEARAWLEKQGAGTGLAKVVAQPEEAPAEPAKPGAPKAKRPEAAPAMPKAAPAESATAALQPPEHGSGGRRETEKTTVESSQATTQLAEDERTRLLSVLNSGLQEMESKQMGAVADRALARLHQRDSERGKGGS